MIKQQFLIVAASLLTILLTCCSVQNPSEPSPATITDVPEISTPVQTKAEYKKITSEEAQALMYDDVIILDVRTQEEYVEGHIIDAVLLPDYEIKEQAEIVITDKNQTVLVYCQTGRRSELVSKELIDMGYKNVFDFGGICDWKGEIVGNWLYPSYYNYYGDDLPPDIITSIDYTTNKKINENMPEFTFHITGSNVKKYGGSYDRTKYYIMFDENKIENISIKDDNGTVVQVLNNLYTENPASEIDMYGLLFDDWNFDGYLDIGLWRYRGGSMGNNPHYYWLWDNRLGKFVENADLEEISEYSYISVNGDTRQIECYTRYGGYGGIVCYYKYENGIFVLVRSKEYNIISAPDDEDRKITHVVIQDLINGEMTITEDYYED